MITKSKPGTPVWFTTWNGVKHGQVIHANTDGDLHVDVDGQVEAVRCESAFDTEADAWQHRATVAVREATEQLATAGEALQKAATSRTLANQPSRAA